MSARASSWGTAGLLTVLLVAGAPGGASAELAAANSWTAYASDPEAYPKKWMTAAWAESIGRLLAWGGHSHNYKGNNSLRAFDPVTNRWEILSPNTWGGGCAPSLEGGVQNRDNHVAFFVPKRGAKGEFWIFGGAYTTTSHPECTMVKGVNFGGRFDLATRRWVNVADSIEGFAAGVIKGFSFHRFVIASAHAWCPELDTGVVFGGSGSNILQIIEPNPGGPEPYRFWKGVVSDGPTRRAQLQNNGVCAHQDFYLYGGEVQTRDQRVVLDDLWRLHLPTRTWTRLASAPAARYQPTLTYDPRAHALVLFGGAEGSEYGTRRRTRDLYVYDIRSDTWRDMTATMQPAGDRPLPGEGRMGDYSPAVGRHIYTGWGQHTDGYALAEPGAAPGVGRPSPPAGPRQGAAPR